MPDGGLGSVLALLALVLPRAGKSQCPRTGRTLAHWIGERGWGKNYTWVVG